MYFLITLHKITKVCFITEDRDKYTEWDFFLLPVGEHVAPCWAEVETDEGTSDASIITNWWYLTMNKYLSGASFGKKTRQNICAVKAEAAVRCDEHHKKTTVEGKESTEFRSNSDFLFIYFFLMVDTHCAHANHRGFLHHLSNALQVGVQQIKKGMETRFISSIKSNYSV